MISPPESYFLRIDVPFTAKLDPCHASLLTELYSVGEGNDYCQDRETNSPKVGDILEVRFPRPRERKALLEDAEYYRLREYLITFLEERAGQKRKPPAAAKAQRLPKHR
jgi:hypothetical protein